MFNPGMEIWQRRRFLRDEKLCVESLDLVSASASIKRPASQRLCWRSPEITMSHCHTGFCYKSLITKRGSDDYSIQYGGLQAAWGSLIKKIQLFVYIHFPHSDYFINCPAFISSPPIPPNNQLLYPDQQTHHRSFVDSKDLLSPSQRAAILWWLGSGKLQSNKSYFWLAGGPPKSLSNSKKWSLTLQIDQGYLRERKAPHELEELLDTTAVVCL